MVNFSIHSTNFLQELVKLCMGLGIFQLLLYGIELFDLRGVGGLDCSFLFFVFFLFELCNVRNYCTKSIMVHMNVVDDVIRKICIFFIKRENKICLVCKTLTFIGTRQFFSQHQQEIQIGIYALRVSRSFIHHVASNQQCFLNFTSFLVFIEHRIHSNFLSFQIPVVEVTKPFPYNGICSKKF